MENVGGSSNTGAFVAAGISGVIGAIGGAIIGAAVGGDTPHHGHHVHCDGDDGRYFASFKAQNLLMSFS